MAADTYRDPGAEPTQHSRGCLISTCFRSSPNLNKLAHGIADNLALSVVAEEIGRGTPVIVGPSLNASLLNHPEARESLKRLPTWGVTIVQPVNGGGGPRLAPSAVLLDAVCPNVRRRHSTGI